MTYMSCCNLSYTTSSTPEIFYSLQSILKNRQENNHGSFDHIAGKTTKVQPGQYPYHLQYGMAFHYRVFLYRFCRTGGLSDGKFSWLLRRGRRRPHDAAQIYRAVSVLWKYTEQAAMHPTIVELDRYKARNKTQHK